MKEELSDLILLFEDAITRNSGIDDPEKSTDIRISITFATHIVKLLKEISEELNNETV